MKRFILAFTVVQALAEATAPHAAHAQMPSDEPISVVPEGLEHRIDELVHPRVDAGNFNGVILVAQGQRIVFKKAYGSAVYEFDIPNALDTRSRIASLSKQFTDIAICSLVERRVMTLDAPVSDFLPEFPRGDEITVRHLLHHESGVKHTNNLTELEHITRLTLDEMIALLATKPLDFDPGTESRYSNGGYDLLAAIVERASGISFEEYLQRFVFARIGLKDTGMVKTYGVTERLARGYLPGRTPGKRGLARFYPSEIRFGGGALYSTAEDVFRVFQTSFSFSLFENEELNEVVGWDRERRYEITGRAPGFVAKVFRDNPNDITVVSLANNYSWQISWGRLLYQAAINDPWPTEDISPVERTISAKDAAYYTGTFAWGDDPPIKLSVNTNGHIVYFDEANDWDVVLIPVANDEYYHPFFDRICVFQGETQADTIDCRSSVPKVDAPARFTRVDR